MPNVVGTWGVAFISLELAAHMKADWLEPTLWCVQTAGVKADYLRPVVPRIVFKIASRFGRFAALQGHLRRRFLRALRPGDIAYLWPPYYLEVIRRAKQAGAMVVAERVNCMGSTVLRALEPAFRHLGRNLPEGWCTPDGIAEELEMMRECDFVFAPNAAVKVSAEASGLQTDRILQASYGWSPTRLAGGLAAQRPVRDPTFVFMGNGSVRKGLPLLLEYWAAAGIRGKLLLVGGVEPDMEASYASHLARPDVIRIGFVSNVAEHLRNADVFVFPSHEEGGPLVTYEAAACGLPSIVSPMGAGNVIRDGLEGIVLDPFDAKGWIAAMRRMAVDVELRHQVGRNAAARAMEFTWEKVGAVRTSLLADALRRWQR